MPSNTGISTPAMFACDVRICFTETSPSSSSPPVANSATQPSRRSRTSRSRADTASAFATIPAISPCSCCFFNCSMGRKRWNRLSASV